MRLRTKLAATAAASALVVLAAAAPAFADGTTGAQTVTATDAQAVSVTIGTSSVVFDNLSPASAASTIDAGTVQVQSNAGYSLSVSDLGGLSNAATTFLADPLQISETLTSGAGIVGQADPAAIDTTEGTSGPGLTVATDDEEGLDIYDINLTQAAAWQDAPGSDYTDTLTYTASAGTV
jgi:hypothetical protein